MWKLIESMKAWSGRAAVAFLTAALVACGGGGGNGGTPVGGGSGGGTTPVVGDLVLELSRNSVSNTDTQGVVVTVTSVDSNRNALANVAVSFSIDSGGVISPADTKTDATGKLTASASMGSDRTNRRIQITVKSGTVTKTASFDVVDSVTGGRVADLALVTSRQDIPSDGSVPMQVTVTTLDANRAALGGSAVSFRITDPGGDAFVSSAGTTDPNSGQLVATVRLGQVKTKRTLTLTAIAGSVQRAVSFDVVDPVIVVPAAADMSLQLDRTNIGNAGSELVAVTATAVDSRRNVVSGIPITFEVDNNASIQVLNSLTDAAGQAKAQVAIGADKSNRIITITARTSGLPDRRASFRVTGVRIQSTAVPGTPAALSTGNRVEYRVVDVNQSAMVGIPITVTPSIVAPNASSGPVVVNGTTDANGSFVYTYTAPAQSGILTLTATAAGASVAQDVTVPAPNTNIPAANPRPSAVTLTLTPNVVRVNSGGETTNRAEIRALFQAAGNAPVRNVRTRFVLVDTNSIGGTIASGTQIVYSDANGVAVSSYSPGDRASPTNGVTIRACWDVNDFAAGDCPNSTDISLTVVSDPLSITIGTDNKIENGPTGLTYVKRFVVLVVDAAGNPKSDVQLTPLLDLIEYGKGFYVYSDVNTRWELFQRVACTAEDTNRNGILDAGEDFNGNAQLEPRKSDVSVSMVGTTRTDANGTAVLKIEYPKSFGSWVRVTTSVAAAGVLSPPATNTRWLDVSSSDITDKNAPPPFVTSPYGTSTSCSNPN